MKASPPVNLTELRAITDGDRAMENTLFDLFASTVDRCVENMKKCLEGGGADQWRNIAHELKGASGTIGAYPLRGLCEEAEHLSPENAEKRQEFLALIASEATRVKAFLQAVTY